MKQIQSIVLVITAFIVIPTIARAQGLGAGSSGSTELCHQALLDRLAAMPTEPLSLDVEVQLVRMREEEKLARDVYANLATRWNVPLFANISRAEQRHMNLVAALLDRYGVTDPVTDNSTGAFTDPELASMYRDFVEAGRSSLRQALSAGAAIEDLDLADLDQLLSRTDNADIKLVANNLAKGSRNHLRKFAGALTTAGFSSYTAQYLSQAQIDDIISSGFERGIVYDEFGKTMVSDDRSTGWGRGRGGAWGRGGGQGRGRGMGRGSRGGPRDGSCLGGSSRYY